MRKWLIWLCLVFGGTATAVLAYAPYLPQLIAEGFPALVWSGRGLHATVAGAGMPRDLRATPAAQQTALMPDLATAFSERGGKALLVYRSGQLELEHYGDGATEETRFNSYSMAKSLVGALVYKALAEQRLTSLDQTLGELLPDDRGLAEVSLRALLTMQAGIDFDSGGKFGSVSGKDSDTSPNPFGPLARLHFLGLAAVEGDLMARRGGEPVFNYQNVNTALLGEVLERVYARPLSSLLSEKIWAPAAASDAFWRQPAAAAPVSAYCCLYATARDWIRIGIYLSENGSAEAPFLPEPLWREYMGLDVPLEAVAVDHYGAHIRQNVLDRRGQPLQGRFTYLMGQGGQVLYLMPQHGLVVYRAGENIQLLHSTLYGAWNSVAAQ